DQTTIMGRGGWKTDAMFRRYAITDEQDQREAQEKLDAAFATRGRRTSFRSATTVARSAVWAACGQTARSEHPAGRAMRGNVAECLMPRRGIEPLSPCGRAVLSRLRLPGPPPRRPAGISTFRCP